MKHTRSNARDISIFSQNIPIFPQKSPVFPQTRQTCSLHPPPPLLRYLCWYTNVHVAFSAYDRPKTHTHTHTLSLLSAYTHSYLHTLLSANTHSYLHTHSPTPLPQICTCAGTYHDIRLLTATHLFAQERQIRPTDCNSKHA